MIFKTKDEILNWLTKNDKQYQVNSKNNAYEFIDIHEFSNQSLLKELIKKDNLSLNFFENLKSEGHQYILNVKGNVEIINKKLEIIPFQFYHVEGSFFCSYNQITSLQGCPQYVGDDFNCTHNRLTSLEYCPQSVGRDFSCAYNQLASLEYCPKVIEGYFYCDYNHLTSLEYCPQYIGGNFYSANNPIMSLEHFPEKINGDSYFYGNKKLLKYKNESSEIYIKEISDDDFLNQTDFLFWQQFHLLEKAKKENKRITDELNFNDIENTLLRHIQTKKL